MRIAEEIKLARGEGEVDLLLTGGLLVNVFSGRVHPADIAVSDGLVVGLGEGYRASEVVRLEGRYVTPGLIDAHVHIESSMLTVGEFARAVVPRGTTAVVTDCHEIANVLGLDGVRYMIRSASGVPLDVYVMLPSCVPATGFETSGAALEAADLLELEGEPGVIGLGELMNFPGTIGGDPGVLAKLEAFAGRPVDGHAPGVTGRELNAYIAAGPDSDHECTTALEAEEKLRKGMHLFLREGSSAKNLLDLLPAVNASSSSRCCLCTDDRNAADLLDAGHMDHIIREAVGAGVSPITAIQMATINTARRFGLERMGAVAPGYRADLAVFDDMDSLRVAMTIKGGAVVASDGVLRAELPGPPEIASSMHVRGFGRESLRVEGKGRVRVIGVVPDQLVTESLVEELPSEGGAVGADVERDILKAAVVERHAGTGNVGVAFVRGFGLKEGAIASTVAHDSHNIVVVGCSDGEMAAAVEHLIETGGGQVAVGRDGVRASLALPVAGLMSALDASAVASGVQALQAAAAGLGCTLADPFMTMSFLALPVIPSLKLTDRGLVDVDAFAFADLFAE